MSINLAEKGFLICTLGATAFFMGSMYFKGSPVKKHDAFKVRQQLLKEKDVKMLYSTMSFFYLQGYTPSSVDSLFTLQRIIEIQKPNIVALPISKEDYQTKYVKAMNHPKYREAMDKLIFNLKNRNREEIQKIEDFDLKNLQKLYLIEHCIKLKSCHLVYGRRTKQEYQKILEAQQKLKSSKNVNIKTVDDLKVQDYTQKIIQQVNPKMKIALVPTSPFKTIIGIIEPQLLYETSRKWKEKFKQNYKHQVIEDEEVLEREQLAREAKKK